MSRTALLVGGSGLVGGHVLDLLLADPHWDRVISIGRREMPRSHAKLEQRVVGLFAIPELPPLSDAFSCLGTTIKTAGSQEAFRAVDHDAVVAVARAAQTAGATGFWHVTALGASPSSRIFYNRVKGEVEHDVAALGFQRHAAVRPSMLDGARPESRPAEQLGLRAMRLVGPVLGRYRPSLAIDVAAALVALARSERPVSPVLDAGGIPGVAASLSI